MTQAACQPSVSFENLVISKGQEAIIEVLKDHDNLTIEEIDDQTKGYDCLFELTSDIRQLRVNGVLIKVGRVYRLSSEYRQHVKLPEPKRRFTVRKKEKLAKIIKPIKHARLTAPERRAKYGTDIGDLERAYLKVKEVLAWPTPVVKLTRGTDSANVAMVVYAWTAQDSNRYIDVERIENLCDNKKRDSLQRCLTELVKRHFLIRNTKGDVICYRWGKFYDYPFAWAEETDTDVVKSLPAWYVHPINHGKKLKALYDSMSDLEMSLLEMHCLGLLSSARLTTNKEE